jgi:hypothetical protein
MRQLQKSKIVIPAEAGIQSFQEYLDPRFRGGDTFFCVLQLANANRVRWGISSHYKDASGHAYASLDKVSINL